MKLALVGLILLTIAAGFAGDFCEPTGECYGGVIATLGEPPPRAVIDEKIDSICGKGKWKMWRINSQDTSNLPTQFKNAKSTNFRFFCLPAVRFVLEKK